MQFVTLSGLVLLLIRFEQIRLVVLIRVPSYDAVDVTILLKHIMWPLLPVKNHLLSVLEWEGRILRPLADLYERVGYAVYGIYTLFTHCLWLYSV